MNEQFQDDISNEDFLNDEFFTQKSEEITLKEKIKHLNDRIFELESDKRDLLSNVSQLERKIKKLSRQENRSKSDEEVEYDVQIESDRKMVERLMGYL